MKLLRKNLYFRTANGAKNGFASASQLRLGTWALLFCAAILTLNLNAVEPETTANNEPKNAVLPKVDILSFAKLDFIDQFQKKHTIQFPAERPIVMTANGRNGQEQIEGWIQPIAKELGNDISFVNIADLSMIPRFLRGFIRKKFVESSEFPIILDFTGKIVGKIPFDPQNMTIIVFDRTGKVLFSDAGPATKAQVASAKQVIREAVTTGSPAEPENQIDEVITLASPGRRE